jgi:diacylglycerol kinase (ATP)
LNQIIKTYLNSFSYAWQGILYLFKNERNAKIHAFATIVVLTMAYCFHIKAIEWIALLLAIAIVLMAEAFNTAIEKLADLVTLMENESIKRIKDMAAGAVLMAAISAFIIGLIVFLPKIMLAIKICR